jgi:hypothetical protein
MKSITKSLSFIFLSIFFTNDLLAQVIGEVVADHYKCETYDHIVIETNRGFTLAQVYSGYSDTYEGHIIEGDLHSYGYTEIYKDGEEVGRIYVEDYMAGESAAQDWCFKE